MKPTLYGDQTNLPIGELSLPINTSPMPDYQLRPNSFPAPSVKAYIKTLVGRQLVSLANSFPGTKAFFQPLGMRTFEGFFEGRTVTAQTPSGESIVFVTDVKNYLILQLFWKGIGYYEPLTAFTLLQLLRAGSAGSFVDVGANIGFFSLLLARLRPGVKVFAFEPNPKNYEVLRRNIAANGFSTVHTAPVALSESPGTATLFIHASDMSASLCPDFEAKSTRGSAEVPVTTLDSYFQISNSTGPVVIKIDVEGNEASVIRGGKSVLSAHSPDLIVEVLKPLPLDVVSLLNDLGYTFYQITDEGLTPSPEIDLVRRGDLLFLNYLFSKRDNESIHTISSALVTYAKGLNLYKSSKYFGN